MNTPFVRTHAVERFRPDPGRLYDVDMTARLAGVPRRSVLVYCRWGFVAPETNPELVGWHFSTDAIDEALVFWRLAVVSKSSAPARAWQRQVLVDE